MDTTLHVRDKDDLRYAMRKRGVRTEDVARRAKVSVTTVNVVLNGHSRSNNVEQAVADLIGVGPDEVGAVIERMYAIRKSGHAPKKTNEASTPGE